MDEVAQNIDSFEQAPPRDMLAHGQQKVEILHILEDSGDPRIPAFLLRVVSDMEQYDMARISALEILRFNTYDEPYYDQIGLRLCFLAQNDKDPDVRIHAALALGNYIKAPGVVEAVLKIGSDSREDTIVRDNAIAALEKIAPDPALIAAVVALTADPIMGSAAQWVLDTWQQ